MALKTGFKAKATAAGLAALSMLPGATAIAEPANGNSVQPASSTRAIDQIDLRVMDTRGKGVKAGTGVAVMGSGNYAILKIHPASDEVIDDIDTYLRRMIMQGYPRVGMVIADGPNGQDNSAELYVLADDGLPEGRFTNINAHNAEKGIRDAIRDNYPRVWMTQSAALDPAAP